MVRRDGPVLELVGVRKSHGDLEVLKGVSFRVDRGEAVCILGTSGAGKSTLLRCINHLEPYDAGIIRVGGELLGYEYHNGALREQKEADIAQMRRRVGMVFQDFALFRHLTAIENITLGPRLSLKVPESRAQKMARRLLELVGLPDKAESYPRELSGGEQQRVAIARALCMEPDLMLLDEPTSALDGEAQAGVQKVIRDVLREQDNTMIIVSHEVGFVREIASRVIILDDGVVLDDDTVEGIIRAGSSKGKAVLTRGM